MSYGQSKDHQADVRSARVKNKLESLGRFAEPAIQFVLGQENEPARRERLEAVLTSLRPEPWKLEQ